MTAAQATAQMTARRTGPLKGRVRAPGDKSISHRALILGALAHGETEVEGLLEGDDVMATARAMAAFGAGVERLGDGHWRVAGKGGFFEPADVIDCGNAGTGVRLIMGAAAGFPLAATFTGETASGWQQVGFSTPVTITANAPAPMHSRAGPREQLRPAVPAGPPGHTQRLPRVRQCRPSMPQRRRSAETS